MLNSPVRYGAVSMTLHWLLAAAIVGMLILGKLMHGLPDSSADKFALFQLHKSIGIAILALTLVRVGWRLINVVPPLPAAMPAWQKWLAHASHGALYVLMIAIPLTGWATASASPLGIPTVWFGIAEVPHLPGVEAGEESEEMFEEAHELLGNLLILLLILHIGAALKHHFWDRDSVLKRMLPFTLIKDAS